MVLRVGSFEVEWRKIENADQRQVSFWKKKRGRWRIRLLRKTATEANPDCSRYRHGTEQLINPYYEYKLSIFSPRDKNIQMSRARGLIMNEKNSLLDERIFSLGEKFHT